LDTLKAQHAILVKSLQTLSYLETQSRHGSPLPTTLEEHGDDLNARQRFPTPSSKSLKRTSTSPSISDASLNEWFDASDGMEDGAQEFFLDVETPPGEKDGLGSKLTRTESPVNTTDQDSESESDAEEVEKALTQEHRREPTEDGLQFVVRRAKLPSGPVGDEGGLFAILKKNVGKVCSGREGDGFN